MSRRLRIVSVCRTLPTPDDPSAGIFVLNRLAAMATHADLTVVQPVPYTPGLRPLSAWAREHSHVAMRGVAEPTTGEMRAADGCISVSHSLRDLTPRHGVPAGRLRVIHNAVEWARLALGARADARRLREQVGIWEVVGQRCLEFMHERLAA